MKRGTKAWLSIAEEDLQAAEMVKEYPGLAGRDYTLSKSKTAKICD